MTIKIKKLREHPLLSPPSEDGTKWARPTADDFTVMTDSIQQMREGNNPLGLAEDIFFLRELGGTAELKAADKRRIRADLNGRRRKGLGNDVAGLLYYMRELGLPAAVTKRDRELIMKDLERNRRENDGVEIARTYFFMQELGIMDEIPQRDKDIMEERTKYFKANRRGDVLPELHYCMESIGLPAKITAQDTRTMKKTMDERHFSNLLYTKMFYYASQLFPTEQTQDSIPAPPLKKFA